MAMLVDRLHIASSDGKYFGVDLSTNSYLHYIFEATLCTFLNLMYLELKLNDLIDQEEISDADLLAP